MSNILFQNIGRKAIPCRYLRWICSLVWEVRRCVYALAFKRLTRYLVETYVVNEEVLCISLGESRPVGGEYSWGVSIKIQLISEFKIGPKRKRNLKIKLRIIFSGRKPDCGIELQMRWSTHQLPFQYVPEAQTFVNNYRREHLRYSSVQVQEGQWLQQIGHLLLGMLL